MTENTISLSKFSNEKPFNIEELNNLFSASGENKFIDFVYDEDFCTFDFKGGYRNGKILNIILGLIALFIIIFIMLF